MKVDVIAKKGFGITPKGGRTRLPRDQARVLERMGIVDIVPIVPVKATPAKKQETAPKRTYQRRDIVAEQPATVVRYSTVMVAKQDDEA